MRTAIEKRKTKETEIEVEINLDGCGSSEISTGIGFFDHMLTTLSRYSMIDMRIISKGDDAHHVIEDVGIALGSAFSKALLEKKGINRMGWFCCMMDDAIAEAIVDISGRGRLIFEDRNGNQLTYSATTVSSVAVEDVREFFYAMAENMRANIAIRLNKKGNSHHEIESTFKAFGKALRMAVEMDARSKGEIPSTKGVIK